MHLVVAGNDTLHTFESLTGHLHSRFVTKEIGAGCLQRVLWRHHQPYFVESLSLLQLSGQRDMSVVYRVKRPTEDASPYHLSFIQEFLYECQCIGLGIIEDVVDHNLVELISEGEFKLSTGDALVYYLWSIRSPMLQPVTQFCD